MAFVNYVNKEISAKIVYYGPGLSGKTTNIVYIHKKLNPESRGKLISLATQTDRTLFFDFLPINLGEIAGFKLRFHLYTVPGQIFYNTTRKMVLKGVDGIVFVADSQKQMLDDNIESLKNLEENLKEYGKNIKNMPMVLQYNKRDLPDVMDIEELHMHLNKYKLPFFQAVAVEGKGVLETLTAICRLVAKKIKESSDVAKSSEEETEEKIKEKQVDKEDAVSKASFLPEDYSEEALMMLDLIGEETKEVLEEETPKEEIEEDLELFGEETFDYDIHKLNQNLFSQKALSYDETKTTQTDEMKIELLNPGISENEIEIPVKFSFGGKEKSLKIKLKFEVGEE